MKTCSICKKEKSLNEFYYDVRYKSNYTPECKLCRSEYRKQWHLKNKEANNLKSKMYDLAHPEEKRMRNKKYYENNKEKHNAYCYVNNRNKTYNITQDIYDTMLNNQKGVCAICGKKETKVGRINKKIKPLSVDHNHNTGKIRGLLCQNCNSGLGLFGDNEDLLIKAANYIKQQQTA